MSVSEIEHGIAIPRSGKGPGRTWRLYPFGQLGLMDSFLVTLDEGDTMINLRARVSVAASKFATRHPPMVFTCRTVPGMGVRVWRIQ